MLDSAMDHLLRYGFIVYLSFIISKACNGRKIMRGT